MLRLSLTINLLDSHSFRYRPNLSSASTLFQNLSLDTRVMVVLEPSCSSSMRSVTSMEETAAAAASDNSRIGLRLPNSSKYSRTSENPTRRISSSTADWLISPIATMRSSRSWISARTSGRRISVQATCLGFCVPL